MMYMSYSDDICKDFLIRGMSLPIIWGVFLFYHLILSRPIAQWFLGIFPWFCEHFQRPYAVVVSILHLVIWGLLAIIWPGIGFGCARKPDRCQLAAVFFLVGISVFAPMIKMFVGWGVPFKQMGFIVWTITPIQEEIMFRGFLYTLLLRLCSRTPDSSWREIIPVLVLGGLWFSLWHLYPPAIEEHGWGVVGMQLIVNFFAGTIFTALRHWTGSIWMGIPVHAAGNFMASLM